MGAVPPVGGGKVDITETLRQSKKLPARKPILCWLCNMATTHCAKLLFIGTSSRYLWAGFRAENQFAGVDMIVFLVWLALVGPFVVAAAAEARGRNPILWFFLALFFTPIWMLPMALVLDRKPISGVDKICPRCAETVKAKALACRYCNYEFPA